MFEEVCKFAKKTTTSKNKKQKTKQTPYFKRSNKVGLKLESKKGIVVYLLYCLYYVNWVSKITQEFTHLNIRG